MHLRSCACKVTAWCWYTADTSPALQRALFAEDARRNCSIRKSSEGRTLVSRLSRSLPAIGERASRRLCLSQGYHAWLRFEGYSRASIHDSRGYSLRLLVINCDWLPRTSWGLSDHLPTFTPHVELASCQTLTPHQGRERAGRVIQNRNTLLGTH